MADPDAHGGGPGHHLPTSQTPILTMLVGSMHLTFNMTLEKMFKDPSLHAHRTTGFPSIPEESLPHRPGKWRNMGGKPCPPSSACHGLWTSLRQKTGFPCFRTLVISPPPRMPSLTGASVAHFPSSALSSPPRFSYLTCHDSDSTRSSKAPTHASTPGVNAECAVTSAITPSRSLVFLERIRRVQNESQTCFKIFRVPPPESLHL